MMAANKLHPTVLEMLSIPDSRGRDVVPWHYIRRDFADGLCFAGALLIFYILAAISWKRFRPFAEMSFWMGIVFFALPVVKAGIIYVKCAHLFDPALAACPWPDFDSYLNDASIQMARSWVPPLGAVLAAIFTLLRIRGQRIVQKRAAADGTSHPGVSAA
ncbi:MAG: hypothetical protein ACO1TE_00680 [Prosthecobacter sp.]